MPASVRHVLRLHDLPQRRVVRIMHRGIEQRPRFGAGQQRRAPRQPSDSDSFCSRRRRRKSGRRRPPYRFAASVSTSSLSAARASTRSCSPPDTLVFFRSGYCSVSSRSSLPMVSTASATISLSPAGIAVSSTVVKSLISFSDGAGAVALIGLHAVADRREIGDEILLVLRRQTEIEHPIEMRRPPDRSCRSGRHENTAR